MSYLVTIGLEVHVQVRTQTKMFCRCPNRYGGDPNTYVCPVCLGYPGVLPVPNEEAIRKTRIAGMMIDCDIALYSKFDRKSYFYPDMPKNYQTSQFDLPFCGEGKVHIEGKALVDEVETRDIRVERIHLEEDVGKSTHFAKHSGIDYNRAGVPLMEIVSFPDMTSADEAYAYLSVLKQTMQYGGISDCDQEKGQMRCDVNISLRPEGQEELNPKTELKNLNSLKAVHRAIEHEIDALTAELERGHVRKQATWGWNDDRGESYFMRSKEDSHDYRYFPCPDLMPFEMTEEELAALRAEVPETPRARRERFESTFGLPAYDCGVLTGEKACGDYFEAAVEAGTPAKKAANWIMNELLREVPQRGISFAECPLTPTYLAELVGLIDEGKISGRVAKDVLPLVLESGDSPLAVAEANDWITDNSAIDEFVQQAIEANPGPVAEYKAGKENALNFLVGQVMKASRGNANPGSAREALIAALSQ
jgi:aspartyl-tRNA(Asn)/glutamyl-tRNA(Gln) amidotransferase subunit B